MNGQQVWDHFKELQNVYPDLVIVFEDGKYLIQGLIQFRAEFMGNLIEESFLIEVEVLASYPQTLPIARELGGRIPSKFHKLADGALCLGAPLAMKISFSKEPTLLSFFENMIIPYLYSFSYFENNKNEFPYGELEHGAKGIISYYMELFEVKSADTVLNILYHLSFKKVRGHLPCPCGSSLKIRNCHGPMLLNLYKFQDASEFEGDLSYCWNYIKSLRSEQVRR